MTASKTSWLGLRLSQDEKDSIDRRAHSAGLSTSEFLRRRCTSDDTAATIIVTDPDILKALLTDLKRIGNNLNQLTKVANQNRTYSSFNGEVEQTLHQLSEVAQDISRFLSDARSV